MKKIKIIIGTIALVTILLLSIFLILDRKPSEISDINLHELRELAWKSVGENQLIHITTKKEDAIIELIESKDKWIIPITEEQKSNWNVSKIKILL